ncbi:UNVERIFIED_CONTAM: hypothetical protein K2H54_050353 [Gekko kuhli]
MMGDGSSGRLHSSLRTAATPAESLHPSPLTLACSSHQRAPLASATTAKPPLQSRHKHCGPVHTAGCSELWPPQLRAHGMKTHKSSQSLVKRRMTAIRERGIADAQKKARQAQRILGDSASVSAKAWKTAGEVESLTEEDAQEAQAMFRDVKEENKRASELRTQVGLTVAEISRQEQETEDLGSKQEGSGQVQC